MISGLLVPDTAISGATVAGLGRLEDALDASQEAVTIRRELAARSPDTYRH